MTQPISKAGMIDATGMMMLSLLLLCMSTVESRDGVVTVEIVGVLLRDMLIEVPLIGGSVGVPVRCRSVGRVVGGGLSEGFICNRPSEILVGDGFPEGVVGDGLPEVFTVIRDGLPEVCGGDGFSFVGVESEVEVA